MASQRCYANINHKIPHFRVVTSGGWCSLFGGVANNHPPSAAPQTPSFPHSVFHLPHLGIGHKGAARGSGHQAPAGIGTSRSSAGIWALGGCRDRTSRSGAGIWALGSWRDWTSRSDIGIRASGSWRDRTTRSGAGIWASGSGFCV